MLIFPDTTPAVVATGDAEGVVITNGTINAEGKATSTVKKGDTLWGIAKSQLGKGARYTEIVALNGLKSATIYAGQKLKLPQQ